MWISKKYFNFLKHKAEQNIDAECQILSALGNQQKSVARAMEEYSAALKERDELRLRVVELEQEVSRLKNA
jgi:transposase-like protein